MIAFFAVFVHHVPKYDGCDHNCCHFPHDASTSQVAYLRGSGGIEYDIHDLEDHDYVDYNIVFKKPYDVTTFSVYAGCGGCASEMPFNWDEPLTLPLATHHSYYDAKLEAFTQHSYYEVLPRPVDENGDDHSPQFNTSALSNCSSKHFSVRLIVHDNATEDIVYGVVVGCEGLSCERFTPLEYMSFPLYVIRNHADWNNAGWTLPVIALIVPLIMGFVLYWWHGGWLAFHVPVGISFPRQLAVMYQDVRHWAHLRSVCWQWSLRCFVYAVATWAIVTDLIETFVHFLIAARDVPTGDPGYYMFAWWYAVKLAFLLAVALPWLWTREVPETLWREGRWECTCGWFNGIGPFSPFWAHGFWSLVDLGVAVAALFVGAGFYVFPVAAATAGAMRLFEWFRGERRTPPCEEVPMPNERVEKKVRFMQVEDTACSLPSLATL